MKLFELPKGWVLTRLEGCAEIILGQSPPSSTYNENGSGFPFYQGKLEFGNIFPTPHKWCTAPKKIAEKGDVLISVRAPVGPTNICPEKSCIGRGLAAIRGLNGMESSFILYLLRAFEDDIAGKGTGTTFNAIIGNQLKGFAVPLPPLPEQHRIVSKIEGLFTKLEVGVKSLEKTKAQLKHYRQSVLKYAFEGKLTEEWREKYEDELEPASMLLERIKEERKKTLKEKYKELPPLDTSELSELSEGWMWARLGFLFDWSNGKGLTKKQMQAGNYTVYGGNGITGTHNEWLCKKEALVIGRVGAHCGNVHLALPESWITDNAIYTSWKTEKIYLRFFYYLLSNCKLNELSGGSGQPYVSQAILNPLLVPITTLPEQHKIVEKIERRFSIADDVEKTIDQSLKQAERLRQSILKTAFGGKLVPQDPTDEPASVLLERIKAEREKREIDAKSKSKNKRKRDLVQKQRRFNDYVE
jgi:type I restriction enzyme S subunit